MKALVTMFGILVWGWGLLFLIITVFYLVPVYLVAWMVGWV